MYIYTHTDTLIIYTCGHTQAHIQVCIYEVKDKLTDIIRLFQDLFCFMHVD